MFNEYDKDSDGNIYESGETDNDDGSDYDNFWFKNHSEDLIVTLYFLLLFARSFITV